MTLKKPARYRDVLALLKQMARDSRVTDGALRAILGGNIGEGYTQADIARAYELAAERGWELSIEPDRSDERVDFDSADKYQEEIRRLHTVMRPLKLEIKSLRHIIATGNARTQALAAKRHLQLEQAGVTSVDEAFGLLERFRAHILAHGSCHSEECGDDESLDHDARFAFIDAHAEICTCGTDEVMVLAEAGDEPISTSDDSASAETAGTEPA